MATAKFKNAQGEWEELGAAKLDVARSINGVPFDGTQDITIPVGSSSYDILSNKPMINGVELNGDKTSTDLNIVSKTQTTPTNTESLWIVETDIKHPVTETAYESALNAGYVGTKQEFDGDLAKISNGDLATGNTVLPTVKDVADKAQFAPNENGTILYHTAKWFTPNGAISTNGTTATSTSSQFTSAMVGAKLIILGEDRIIVSYISGSQVTVNSDYSQNYNSIGVNNWGVYNIMYRELPNGDQVWYTINSSTPYMKLTYYGTTSIYEFYQLNNYFSFFDSFRSKSNFHFRWASGNSYIGTYDIGFNRNSAGVLEINDGNTAGTYRDVNLRNLNYYGTLNNASDERLKHDIRPVNDGLEKICKLAECVKHFEFNNQDIYAKGQRTGFIAQLLKANGFEGHVTEREPANEEEGVLFGWTYKDEEYEELNPETQEVEIKTRRVVDVKGDMVLQIENNFSPYLYPAVAELKRQNDELRSELDLIKQKLGIA